MLSHGLVAWSCFLDDPATGLWFSQFSAGIDAAGHGPLGTPGVAIVTQGPITRHRQAARGAKPLVRERRGKHPAAMGERL